MDLLDRATTPSSAPAPAPDVPHYNRPDGPGPGPHPYLPPSPPPGLPHYNRPNSPGLGPHAHLPPPPGRARQPLHYPSYQPDMPHLPPHAHNVPPVVPAVLNDDTTDTSSSGTDSDVPIGRAGPSHGAGTNSSSSVVTTPTNSESELLHIPDALVPPAEAPARGAVPRATVHTDVEESE
ncbi:hypothetical protein DXG01_014949 [Tephrocybe rancida]|nr:hypothetical protein DXG01_014949 [Tephrocybe rancida]